MSKTQNNQGLTRFVFLVVVAVLILSYLGFDLKTFIESDQTQGNLKYVWNLFLGLWNGFIAPIWTRYIQPILSYFWGFVGPTLENFGDGSLDPSQIITPAVDIQ